MPQDYVLCPFSKPIIGKWCQCTHARLLDRCSGKMVCTATADVKYRCDQLDKALKTSMRFVLGVNDQQLELTHAQLMKIRCGGFSGMQRVLGPDDKGPPDIQQLINKTLQDYQSIDGFPYNQLVQDIKNFRHRK